MLHTACGKHRPLVLGPLAWLPLQLQLAVSPLRLQEHTTASSTQNASD